MRKKYLKSLRKNVSGTRFLHSISVERTAKKLAKCFSADQEKAAIAGLLHDFARELPLNRINSLATADGNKISEWEQEFPVLLHGRASAVLINRKFGIADEVILEAVRNHTAGAKGMSDVAKIVFIADYIEPNRSNSNKKRIARLLHIENNRLDRILYHVVMSKYNFSIKRQQKIIQPLKELCIEYGIIR